jgi:K+/H+ antiporter YhaU regulatory subunit KhtT
MAHLILRPRIVDFFETALHRGSKTLSISEIQVLAGSKAIGEPLLSLRKRSPGATILAVLRSPDGVVALATDELELVDGDHLLALGTDEQLQVLETSLR